MYILQINGKIQFFEKYFIIKYIKSILTQRLDKDWLATEEELLFIAEKLAYRPQVVYMVLLFCSVS